MTDLTLKLKSAKKLLNLVFKTLPSNTPEERARAAWRANDTLWRNINSGDDIIEARLFNNLVQDYQRKENWPWIDNLWSKEEIEEIRSHV